MSSPVSRSMCVPLQCLFDVRRDYLFLLVILFHENVMGINRGIWISIVWAQAGEIDYSRVDMYSMYTGCRCFFVFTTCVCSLQLCVCSLCLQLERLSDRKWLLISYPGTRDSLEKKQKGMRF